MANASSATCGLTYWEIPAEHRHGDAGVASDEERRQRARAIARAGGRDHHAQAGAEDGAVAGADQRAAEQEQREARGRGPG